MRAIGRQVEDYFLPHVNADGDAYAAGETRVPPMAYLNMQVTPTRIRIIAETLNPRHIEALMDEITRF
jgi:hypothetical protein